MGTPNPNRVRFLQRLFANTNKAIAALNGENSLVSEYQNLGYGDPTPGSQTAITADDMAAAGSSYSPADVAAAIAVGATVATALAATSNAGMTALQKMQGPATPF